MTKNMTKKERDQLEQGEMNIKDNLNEIKPPYWLENDLKERFNWYVEQAKELNILTILDADYLAKFIYYENRFVELDQEIKKMGFMINEKINPLLVEQRQIHDKMEKLSSKLGFNPTDRLRFAQKEVEKVDELELFRNEI